MKIPGAHLQMVSNQCTNSEKSMHLFLRACQQKGDRQTQKERRTHGQTDKRTHRQIDRRTGWNQYTPPASFAWGIFIELIDTTFIYSIFVNINVHNVLYIYITRILTKCHVQAYMQYLTQSMTHNFLKHINIYYDCTNSKINVTNVASVCAVLHCLFLIFFICLVSVSFHSIRNLIRFF